jgi:NADH:ubiquinone oxidoreductase subunit 3 (subunit A)
MATNQITYLFGGIVTNIIIFYFTPVVLALLLRKRVNAKKETLPGILLKQAVIDFCYLGQGYPMLKGFIDFFRDIFIKEPKPFGSANINPLKYSFSNALNILNEFYTRNIPYILCSLLYIFKSAEMLYTSVPITIPIAVTASFMFFLVFIPVILTPQLFPHRDKKNE